MVEKYYEIKAPEVISEPMEEEMVVINLDNGCYYSLNKTAASLWNDLEQGLSIHQAAGRMALRYGSEEAQVLADLASFVERLLEERLIDRERLTSRQAFRSLCPKVETTCLTAALFSLGVRSFFPTNP